MKAFLFLFVAAILPVQASPFAWTSAVPQEIHLVPDGMILVGNFNLGESKCAYGSASIFLSRQDPMFKEKLTLALTAKASNKRIKAALLEPREYTCIDTPDLGGVPMVSHYFWQLTD